MNQKEKFDPEGIKKIFEDLIINEIDPKELNFRDLLVKIIDSKDD